MRAASTMQLGLQQQRLRPGKTSPCIMLPRRQQQRQQRQRAPPTTQVPALTRRVVVTAAAATTAAAREEEAAAAAAVVAQGSVPAPPSSSSSGSSTAGLARRLLAARRHEIEGDPLAALDAVEKFWAAARRQRHEPWRPGPTVVTVAPPGTRVADVMAAAAGTAAARPAGARPLRFGASPHPQQAQLQSRQRQQRRRQQKQQQQQQDQEQQQPPVPECDFDVLVCGGTLGLVIALALQLRGWSVAVVEKRLAVGRHQEWNTSRAELAALQRAGLLTRGELDACVASAYGPVRCSFPGLKGGDLYAAGALDVGVRPAALLAAVRARFEQLGGIVYEHTAFASATVCGDGVVARLRLAGAGSDPLGAGDANRPNAVVAPVVAPTTAAQQQQHHHHHHLDHHHDQQQAPLRPPPPRQVSARLLVDQMGAWSPIAKQQRGGAKPDGAVLVVGACVEGPAAAAAGRGNTTADLLVALPPQEGEVDDGSLWEAFPAEGGAARTAYRFSYADAAPTRPSIERLLDEYFAQLPRYLASDSSDGSGSGSSGSSSAARPDGGNGAHAAAGASTAANATTTATAPAAVDPALAALDGLRVRRVLFGAFPSYAPGRGAPLRPAFDRVVSLGDAAAAASPLSFGGFNALLRQLPRVAPALDDALLRDRLCAASLGWVNCYSPSIACAWLFQRAMALPPPPPPPAAAATMLSDDGAGKSAATSSVASEDGDSSGGVLPLPLRRALAALAAMLRSVSVSISGGISGGSAPPPPGHVARLLAANFTALRLLGARAAAPFLADVLQPLPLAASMALMGALSPLVVLRTVRHVGPLCVAAWFGHFAALVLAGAAYLVLAVVDRLVPSLRRRSFTFARLVDALRWGCGADFDEALAAHRREQQQEGAPERAAAAAATTTGIEPAAAAAATPLPSAAAAAAVAAAPA